MKSLIQIILCSFFILNLSACGTKEEQTNTDPQIHSKTQNVYAPEITDDNLKQSKEALLQQMANDLYLEVEKELEAAPAVKMDERGIYDDIKKVDVEINLPEIDVNQLKVEEPEKIVKD